MKDIVIIANFCRDFSKTDNGRFMYLCKELSNDNNIEIITSDFSHSTKEYKKPLQEKWPFKIIFLHETGYKKNVSIKRFFSHHYWGKEVEKYIKNRKEPDVIYCAIPSLTASAKIAKYCEKKNIRFIVDIQDLWPEAFKMVFHIPIISNIAFAPFTWIANTSYKRADEVIAVSQTYVDRAMSVNKKCKKGHAVFLGTNLDTFDENVKNNKVKSKSENELWLGYCGTLGASYDLTVVFDALRIIDKKGLTPPKFIVMGSGPREDEFKQKAKGINTEFTGLLPYPKMCGILAACDMVVNPISHGAAQSIINKHGDYAASGLPVINTQEGEEYRDLVEFYHMGFNCKNGDATDLADKICLLMKDKELRLEMGKNARKCAEEKFDRRNSYKEILDVIAH